MSKHYKIHHGLRKKNKLRKFAIVVACLSLIGLGAYSEATNTSTAESGKEALNQAAHIPASAAQVNINAPMPWPNYGHSAYIVPGDNLVGTSGSDAQPVPIASLAKVITVLAILQKQPLQVGEQGPTITLSEQDVAFYSDYMSKNGTVVPVANGEQISQYQALQAILMASANNMSDSLVTNVFGSVDAYTAYANKMLRYLGLEKTVVADASGYSPKTVSTAKEMAQLGYLYMQNPVLRSIAQQPQADIPLAGKIANYNAFMNQGGLIGIKVGDTDEAGRCFLAADIRQSGSKEEMSIVVVLGADHLKTAGQDAQTILNAGNKYYDQLNNKP